MNKKGFTLIELLVVIAIIGLLTTIAVVALQQSRARARDMRRLSDVKQIQTALGLFQNDALTYPTSLTPGGTIATGTNVFMEIVPIPPTPDDGCTGSAIYTYTPLGTAGAYTGYTINYCLGSANNSVKAGLNTATPSGIRQPD